MSTADDQGATRVPYADFIPRETPEQIKARLYAWHANAGTMGVFYDLYPDDLPYPQWYAHRNGVVSPNPRNS